VEGPRTAASTPARARRLYVVQGVALLRLALHKAVFVAGHSLQHTQVQQRLAHRHQGPPFGLGLQAEAEAA
jgi:hypothetical protein